MKHLIQLDIVHEGQANKAHISNLYHFIDSFPINTICLDMPARSIQTFTPDAIDKDKNILLSYNHSPVMTHSFLKDIHKTDQIFQPLLFCRKNYFKQHKSWGFPIFHFSDDEPEIYDFTPSGRRTQFTLPYPEDIAALYILSTSGNTIHTQNVISYLDRNSGTVSFSLKEKTDFTLVVFRRLYLYFDHGLRYLINIHDDFLLARHGKKIINNKKFVHYDEARLDADNFFAQHGFISYTPEITRNYKHISNNRFLADKALHIYRYRCRQENDDPKQIILYNRYLNGNLLAKLNYIHHRVSLIASICNIYMIRNLATMRTVFRIDTDRFQFEPGYKQLAVCNIQRVVSHLSAENHPGPVLQAGTLFDITRTFDEKRAIIDQLTLYGAGSFNFRIILNDDNDAFFNQFIFLDTERKTLYKHWLTYINHITKWWNNGKRHGGALVLFPSWESGNKTFLTDMKHLLKSGTSFQVIDQDEISALNIMVKTGGALYTKLGIFDYILIPSITVLSMEAVKEIADIVDHGGNVVALQNLPDKMQHQTDQPALKRFISEYWLSNPGKPAISFKEHASGGRTYRIREPENIISFSQIIPSVCPLRVLDENILAWCRKVKDGFLFFLINTSGTSKKYISFSGKNDFIFEKYDPFTDTYQSLSVQHQNKYIIEQPLRENESLLMRLRPGKIPKLPPHNEQAVSISPNDWYVEKGSRTETTRLGDRSIVEPYAWQPLTYSKLFMLPEQFENGDKLFIDFGNVKSWGSLRINDKELGFRLFPPFRWEITHLIRPGKNGITLRVGHQLSNYFALDDNNTGHISPVKPYGLLGPVKLIIRKNK